MRLVSSWLLLAAAPIALAQPLELQVLPAATSEVRVKRMVELDARGRLIGGWIDTANGGIAAGGCTTDDYDGDGMIEAGEPFLFDFFEIDIDGADESAGSGDDESPTNGLINDGYDPCCDLFGTTCSSSLATIRWFQGATSCLPQSVNYFCVEPGSQGMSAGRFNVAWWWEIDSIASSCERCLIVLQIWDDFDSACAGPPVAGSLGGAVFEITSATACDLDGDATGDELASSRASESYYHTGLDLCFMNGGAGMSLPGDGCGAYQLLFGKDFIDGDGDGTLDTLVYATCAQNMLWGDKGPNPGSHLSRDFNGDGTPDGTVYWRDHLDCEPIGGQPLSDCTVDANGDGQIRCDTDGDGTFDLSDWAPDGVLSAPCECRVAHFNPGCPEMDLQAMLGMWKFVGNSCAAQTCGDNDCDSDVDSFDIAAFVQNLTDPAGYCSAHPGCDRFCAGDADGDGDVDSFDISAFVTALVGSGCPGDPAPGGCP